MEQWVIYALLSAFTAGLVGIFGKIGLENVDSTLATTVRAFVMFLFLAVDSLSTKKFQLINRIDSRAFLFIILSGIMGAVSWLAYFLALKAGSVSKVVPVDRLSIVFAVVLAVLFLGESVNLASVLGIIIMVIGAVLLAI